MIFYPAEKICAIIVALLFLLDVCLISVKGVHVAWLLYSIFFMGGLAVLAVGQFYRTYRPDEKIAMTATATGIYLLFTLVGSVFNNLLLPVSELRDVMFIQWDQALGFNWLDFVNAIAEVPFLGVVLRIVYLSSLIQLVVVIIFVGLKGDARNLHLFLLCGILAALMTILIWWAFPTSTPAAYYTLSDEVANRVQPVVDQAYGLALQRLDREGAIFLSPRDTLGLVSFPSFHTVMACLSVWFTRSVRRVFPLIVVINTLMVPAILVHGGHNLVDVIAGIGVFAVALFAAGLIIANAEGKPQVSLATA
jgi:hypothetical protein